MKAFIVTMQLLEGRNLVGQKIDVLTVADKMSDAVRYVTKEMEETDAPMTKGFNWTATAGRMVEATLALPAIPHRYIPEIR